MNQIHLAGSKAVSAASRRIAPVGGGSWAISTAVAVVIAMGLAVSLWLTQHPKSTPQPTLSTPPAQSAQSAPAVPVETKTESAKQAPADDKTPLKARWTFEKGPAEDLKVIQGNWIWRGDGKTPGWMVSPLTAQESALVELPIELPHDPMLVNIRATPIWSSVSAGGPCSAGAFLMNGKSMVPHKQYTGALALLDKERSDYKGSVYLFDRYAVVEWDGKTIAISVYPSAYPTGRIALSFCGLQIHEIEAKPIKPADIPQSIRDVPHSIETLGVAPVEFDEKGNRELR
jgi:hypothetical protein